MLRVGQRVVCINGDWRSARYMPPVLPVKGMVYTIAEISVHPRNRDIVCLRLVEICEPVGTDYPRRRHYWAASRFRPLDESRLDQFRVYLENVPVPGNTEFV